MKTMTPKHTTVNQCRIDKIHQYSKTQHKKTEGKQN